MTKAKAKRMAVRLEKMAEYRTRQLHKGFSDVMVANDVRSERDFLYELAFELRLLSEGKRLPRKVTR